MSQDSSQDRESQENQEEQSALDAVIAQYPLVGDVVDACSGLTSEHGLKANGADEAIEQLMEFIEATKRPFDIFFNGSGEGKNLVCANSYCSIIPEKYLYNKVRTLILDNLDNGFEKIVNDAMRRCLDAISSVIGALTQIDYIYVDFVENREKYMTSNYLKHHGGNSLHFAGPGASGYLVTEGEGGYGDGYWPGQASRPEDNPALAALCDTRLNFFLTNWGPGSNYSVYETNIDIEAYKEYRKSIFGTEEEYLANHPSATIEDYNSLLEYSYSVDDYGVFCQNTDRDMYEGFTSWNDVLPTVSFSDALEEAKEKIKEAADLIQQWLNLGLDVLKKLSDTQHIYGLSFSTLYSDDGKRKDSVMDVLVEKIDTVKAYSELVSNEVDKIKSIKDANPYARKDKINEKVNDTVFVELEVKSKCLDWYDKLEELFEKDPLDESEGDSDSESN